MQPTSERSGSPTEDEIRAIAREEAQEVYETEIEDASGKSWSLRKLMDRYQLSRRQALAALGLIASGAGVGEAIKRAIVSTVGTAEAASSDDLTVPGTLDVDDATIANAPTSDDDALRWQEGVETGEVQADGANNSGGNDHWGQSAATISSVSFANAFKSTPNVVLTPSDDLDGTARRQYVESTQNRSTTGFDARFDQMTAADYSGSSDVYGADYYASEGR